MPMLSKFTTLCLRKAAANASPLASSAGKKAVGLQSVRNLDLLEYQAKGLLQVRRCNNDGPYVCRAFWGLTNI